LQIRITTFRFDLLCSQEYRAIARLLNATRPGFLFAKKDKFVLQQLEDLYATYVTVNSVTHSKQFQHPMLFTYSSYHQGNPCYPVRLYIRAIQTLQVKSAIPEVK
jgi:hypothetical protein